MNLAIAAVFILFLIVTAYLVWAAATDIGRQQARTIAPKRTTQSSPTKPSVNSGPEIERLQKSLLRLLQGDRAIAQRLLEHVAEKYPGRSRAWCYEKVIDDLVRDRRP